MSPLKRGPSTYSSSSDSSGGVALPVMDESGAEAAMQQMMGFSSFGSGDKEKKWDNKRQKLNSGKSGLPLKPPATASNSTPLGTRQPPTMSATNLNSASHPIQASSKPSTEAIPQSSTADANMTDSVTAAEEATSASDANAASIPLPASPAPNRANDGHSSLITTLNPSGTGFSSTQADAPDSTIYTASDIRSNPTYWTNNSANTSTTATAKTETTKRRDKNAPRLPYPDNDEIGYTNPDSGYTMTNRELNEYHVGKDEVQADGSVVKVYFKPSFLEDPWADFAAKAA